MNTKIVNAIQMEAPVKSYKKTINGKVAVWVFNPIVNQPEQILLQGVGEDAVYQAFSELENTFFKRMNKKALSQGTVIEFESENSQEVEYEFLANSTDEELRTLISQPYKKFKKDLESVKSEAVVIRLLRIATEAEKSETILNLVRAKLSEVQSEE